MAPSPMSSGGKRAASISMSPRRESGDGGRFAAQEAVEVFPDAGAELWLCHSEKVGAPFGRARS